MKVQLVSREYEVHGIHVSQTGPDREAHSNPMVLVHGGLHGAWCWERYVPYFAARGWQCHALTWRGRGQSARLPEREAVRRPIEDVADDIEAVAASLSAPPVIVAHSMGALASLKFAERNPHAGLVLLTPALPAEVSPTPVDLAVDPDSMWGPPPFDTTRELFFSGAEAEDARRYYGLLVPESAKAVTQACADSRVSIDPVRISGPGLVMAAEFDMLSPPAEVRRLAGLLGMDYRYARGFGHGVMLDKNAESVAQTVQTWLTVHVSSAAGEGVAVAP
ncbi:alpha/beta fold hydrolase [Streptomyces sp. Li-HN-5-11]|uniref:alpha/beta hydrolase n=1 Tax=Streptomyces sp. Li-HN-5-11 TaxID=3075432 RepID=UPI0028A7912A|nr:alpha/beta fold hydrolase [Streptomyces sp. Li-HN-5-11]WNM31765.1 alpha/beta fold hydrolase [Streptomyces sp. Li-HN-5-11]